MAKYQLHSVQRFKMRNLKRKRVKFKFETKTKIETLNKKEKPKAYIPFIFVADISVKSSLTTPFGPLVYT